MTTALATLQNTQLPAHLQGASAQSLALNDAALGGIKSGGFPSISIKGAKFHIKDPAAENPFVTIMVTMQDGVTQMPAPYLDLVVIAANPALSKKFYDGPYDDSADDKSPDCSSEDGLAPDAHITSPVSASCALCPKNAWGSKITPQGKETKACSDSKRLVIIPSAALDFKALALDITPAALKEYGAYVRTLSARNIPIIGVVTRVTFDPTAAFPKLKFDFQRFLSAEEFTQVQARIDSDEVRNIVAPKRVVPIQPALPAPAGVTLPDPTAHNMSAAISAAAQNAANNAPVTEVDKNAATAAAQVIQFPGAAPATPAAQPAAPAAGGMVFGQTPAEPAKRGRGRPAKTQEAPAPAVDAVTAAAAAVTVAAPFDINTVPEPYKAAIIAAGGPSSVGGAAIYAAVPKAVAPTPPVVQAQPTAFATPAPNTTVASGPDLATALGNLLGKKS
jgi:hypothetical protein